MSRIIENCSMLKISYSFVTTFRTCAPNLSRGVIADKKVGRSRLRGHRSLQVEGGGLCRRLQPAASTGPTLRAQQRLLDEITARKDASLPRWRENGSTRGNATTVRSPLLCWPRNI